MTHKSRDKMKRISLKWEVLTKWFTNKIFQTGDVSLLK